MNTTKRILIAEDEETQRVALREILKAEPGWNIIEAKDGQEAIDLLADGLRPELCLLDLRMPRLDGIEMLKRMRRDPILRDIKVVVTSSTRDKETIVALARLSISGYLLKPYNAEKTLATLRPLVASNSANPSLYTKNLLNHTALIADDNATERAALKEIFKTEPNWEIVMALDGQDALDRLHTGLRPDLILVDLKMPKVDGFSFIQTVREDPNLRKLRIAVISADHDREKVRALAQLNIAGYLLKPFDTLKVKAVLQQASGTTPALQTPVSEIITK